MIKVNSNIRIKLEDGQKLSLDFGQILELQKKLAEVIAITTDSVTRNNWATNIHTTSPLYGTGAMSTSTGTQPAYIAANTVTSTLDEVYGHNTITASVE